MEDEPRGGAPRVTPRLPSGSFSACRLTELAHAPDKVVIPTRPLAQQPLPREWWATVSWEQGGCAGVGVTLRGSRAAGGHAARPPRPRAFALGKAAGCALWYLS